MKGDNNHSTRRNTKGKERTKIISSTIKRNHMMTRGIKSQDIRKKELIQKNKHTIRKMMIGIMQNSIRRKNTIKETKILTKKTIIREMAMMNKLTIRKKVITIRTNNMDIKVNLGMTTISKIDMVEVIETEIRGSITMIKEIMEAKITTTRKNSTKVKEKKITKITNTKTITIGKIETTKVEIIGIETTKRIGETEVIESIKIGEMIKSIRIEIIKEVIETTKIRMITREIEEILREKEIKLRKMKTIRIMLLN